MPIVVEPTNPYPGTVGLIGLLPQTVQTTRERLGLTVKQAATLAGIGADTLANLEAGSNYTKATLLAVLGWLSTTV